MKTYKTKNTLERGDFVELARMRDVKETKYNKTITYKEPVLELYIVDERRRHLNCIDQCDLYNPEKGCCTGQCYRFKNDTDIVFHLAEEPRGNYVVCETHESRQVRLQKEKQDKQSNQI